MNAAGGSGPDSAGATEPGQRGARGGSLPPALLLYDGVCGLCDRTVQFLLRVDRAGALRFAPLQGTTAAAALRRHGIEPPDGPATPEEAARQAAAAMIGRVATASAPTAAGGGSGGSGATDPLAGRGGLDSVVFVRTAPDGAETVHVRSSAVLAALATAGGAWTVLATVARIVPRPLRDVVYDWVARHRYRWFGRYDSCRVMSPEERDRFLP